jgi:hypothetical protein
MFSPLMGMDFPLLFSLVNHVFIIVNNKLIDLDQRIFGAEAGCYIY